MKKKTIWISAAVAAVLVLGGAGTAVAVTDPFDTDADDQLTGSALEKASAAALAEVGEGTVTDAESDDDGIGAYEVEVTMKSGEEINVYLDSSFAVVGVENEKRSGRDDDADGTDDGRTNDTDTTDTPLTAAEKASAEKAALAEVDGTVTDIDRSDDADHAFEVEVTRADGTDVDVELDEKFEVVRVDDDSEGVDSNR